MKKTLGKLRGAVDNLTGEDWASIHFKVALGFMWPIAFSGTEDGLASNLGFYVVAAWMTVTAAGTIVSITGMIMTAQAGMTRLRGFRVELVGLAVFLAGPLTYFAAQTGWLFVEPTVGRVAQICLAYALCAAVVMRILKVRAAATRALQPGRFCS